MPASTPPSVPRHNTHDPYPFLANDIWADYRGRPTRWPWIVMALLVGGLLAALVTDWSEMPFIKQQASHREPRVLPTAVMTTTPLDRKPREEPRKETDTKEPGSILQVDRTGIVPRLPGAAPESSKLFPALSLDQQQPRPSSSELTLQSSMVRLPPLSLLRIYFAKPYKEPPVVKLRCETVMPGEVSIDEVTTKYVVIRNAHVTNDCYFRYSAEGKLEEGK